MSVGAFFDKIMYLGFGIYIFYLSVAKKEKLGNKAALMRLLGILMILLGIGSFIFALLKK